MKERIIGQIGSLHTMNSKLSSCVSNQNILDCLDPFNIEITDRRFRWNFEKDRVLTNTIRKASIYSHTGDGVWIDLDINFHTGYFNNEFSANNIMSAKYKVRMILNNGWKIRFNNMVIENIRYENDEYHVVKPSLRCENEDIVFVNSDWAEYKYSPEMMTKIFDEFHSYIRKLIIQQTQNDSVPELNFGTIELEEMEGKE